MNNDRYSPRPRDPDREPGGCDTNPEFWEIIDANYDRSNQLAHSLWADELERLTTKP